MKLVLFLFLIFFNISAFGAILSITSPVDTEHSPIFVPSSTNQILVKGDVVYTPATEEGKLGDVYCNNTKAVFGSIREMNPTNKYQEWAVTLPLNQAGILEIECSYKKEIFVHTVSTRVIYSGINKNVDIEIRLSNPSARTYEFKAHSKTGINLNNFAWSFSSGETAVGNNRFVSFSSAGAYTVNLIAKDSANNTYNVSKNFNVSEIHPKVDFESFVVGSSETTNTYNVDFRAGNFSSIPEGTISSFEWDFGDGTQIVSSGSSSILHLYQSPGVYEVKLKAISDQNAGSIKSKTVTISEPLPPVVDFDFEYKPNRAVFLDAGKTYDPENRTLIYEWDFGEGQGWVQGYNSNVLYGYNDGGTYTVKVRVTNSAGFTSIKSKSINMGALNPPTTVDVSVDYMGRGDRAEITFGTIATLPNYDYIENWEWNFGDGSPVRSGFLPTVYHDYTAGNYQMSLTLTDNHQNTYVVTKDIKILDDYTWPWLDTEWEYYAILTSKLYPFDFKVQDASPSAASIFINGIPFITYQIPANSNQLYSPDLPLIEGTNLINIQIRDAAGNIANWQMIRVVDSTGPVLLSVSPTNGETLYNIENVVLTASANEELSVATLNGESLSLDPSQKSFTTPLTFRAGLNNYELKLTDLLGNESTIRNNYTVVVSLLNKGLVSITPGINAETLIINGSAGSTREGTEIEISGGFFNSVDVVPNPDGSWSGEIDFTRDIVITAHHEELDYTETHEFKYNVDTTLSGIVKDPNDNALPGVKVTILSSNQTTLTNAAGVFSIPNPVLGDQDLKIDGSTIPVSITNNQMEFSSVNMKVSIGNKQLNVIERTIYISPKITDGTEVEVSASGPVQVTTSHAPGLLINIPAGAATFPNGSKVGTINASIVPASKTSVEMPGGVEPQSVFALEPSGLKFNQPVHLVLPNENDFPEGIELVILSKNSATGTWEIDGSATVAESGNIETKPGQGISHFSEVFAAPFGLVMTAMGDKDRPGITNDIGNLTTSINLPTYLRLGKSISPKLIYNSQWASPFVTVSNLFQLPRDSWKKVDKGGGNFLGIIEASSSSTIQQWITPETIDTQLFIGEHSSPKYRFEAESAPKKAVVTYGVETSNLPSGVYSSIAEYEIRYRNLVMRTTKTRERKYFGAGKTTVKDTIIQDTIDSIFPPELRSTIHHQNKKNSEYGAGWKFAINDQILNPGNDRLMIENADGSVSTYSLQNSVETRVTDSDGVQSLSGKEDSFYYADEAGNIYSFSSSSTAQPTLQRESSKYAGSIGVNAISVVGQDTYCCKSGWSGCTKRCPSFHNKCVNNTYTFNMPKKINSILGEGADNFIFLDSYGSVWQSNGSESQLAGYIDNIPTLESTSGDISSICQSVVQKNCEELTLFSSTTRNFSRDDRPGVISQCGNYKYSQGVFPVMGYSANGLNSSKFNKPLNMIPSWEPNTYLVADTGNNVIRKIYLAQNTSSIVVGNMQTYDNGDGGLAKNASIYHPRGLAKDSLGNLYISTENGYIRKVNPEGLISTIAGKPRSLGGQVVEQGPMLDFNLQNPSSMVMDEENGYLYVADTGNNRIVKLDLIEGLAKVIGGNGLCNPNAATIEGSSALDTNICSPLHISLDSSNNILFLDSASKKIRKINFNKSNGGVQRYASSTIDNSYLTRLSNGSFERHFRDGTVSKYNSEGYQTSIADPIGNQIIFSYDSEKRLISFTDPSGSLNTLSYSNGRLETFRDGAGRESVFEHDSEGNLINVEFPDSSSKSFTYSATHLMNQETDARGNSTLYHFNDLRKLSSVTTPDNASISLQDSSSKTYYNSLQGVNRKLINYDDENADGISDSVINAKGAETTFVKEKNGYVSKIIDSQERVTTIERDNLGRPLKIIRPDQTFSQFVYDQATGDLLSKYESATNSTESFVYNPKGLLTKYTSPKGKVSTKQYDEITGLLLKETDPRGVFTTYNYGSFGLISSTIDSLSRTQSFEYDAQGNLTRSVLPMNEAMVYTRDVAGNVLTKANSKNQVSSYSFDAFNRLLSVTTPSGKTTSYTYLLTGELAQITNPEEYKTTFEYNSMGRLKKKISPKGQITQLSYDANGNVTQEIDPNGAIKVYEYNIQDQLTKKIFPDNEYIFTYTDTGKPATISNLNSTFNYTYATVHGEEQVSAITQDVLDIPSNTIDYSYREDGKLIAMESNFISYNYQFNDSDMLSRVENSLGQVFSFGYDLSNRLTTVSRNGVFSTQHTFDANSFLKEMVHRKSGLIVSQFNYSRDEVGNRTNMTTLAGAHNYQYDSEGQLTSSSHPEADALHQLETFTHDSLGNRAQDNQGSYIYDSKKHLLEEDWKYLYSYDPNGNLTSKQEKNFGKVWNYTYSSENQLLIAQYFDNNNLIRRIEMSYDALGRRVQKKIIENSQERTRKYVYNSNEIIAELDEDNDVLVKYTHSGLRTDDVLSMDVTSEGVSKGIAPVSGTYYFLKDSLGSIIDIANSSGAFVQHYVYSSYGKLLKIENMGIDQTQNPSIKTSYSYTNREYDSEMGLYYYRARYYDAHSGRFMQEDPQPGGLELPISVVNRYIYAHNNSTNLTDPEGESPLLILFVFTFVQTAFQAGAKNGNWLDNFKASFDKPFSGGNRGYFWENLMFNGMAMAFGFKPGLDLKTLGALALSFIEADISDKAARDGYNSNYLGFRVGVLGDSLMALKFIDRATTVWNNKGDLNRLVNHVPSYSWRGL